MSAPERTWKSRALVLRARNLGEADRIVTLLTLERGKVDAVAKGVRKPTSRLGGRLEFASEVSILARRGRSLDVIASAEIERAYWTSIVDPAAFATAHLMIELVDAFCEHDMPLPDVYALLAGALRAAAASDDPGALVPRFELRLLGALGIGPEIDACVRCGEPFVDAAAWASLDAGGLACERCRPHGAESLALAPADVANLRAVGAAPGGSLRPALRATPASARAVDAFVSWHLGRRPRASALLAEVSGT